MDLVSRPIAVLLAGIVIISTLRVSVITPSASRGNCLSNADVARIDRSPFLVLTVEVLTRALVLSFHPLCPQVPCCHGEKNLLRRRPTSQVWRHRATQPWRSLSRIRRWPQKDLLCQFPLYQARVVSEVRRTPLPRFVYHDRSFRACATSKDVRQGLQQVSA